MELKDYDIKGTTKCECGHEFTLKDFQSLNRINQHGFYANNIKHYSPAICPNCQKETILLLKQKGQTYVVIDIATKKQIIENDIDKGQAGNIENDIDIEPTSQIQEESETSQEFICPECKKVCKNQLGLNAHMRTHTN